MVGITSNECKHKDCKTDKKDDVIGKAIIESQSPVCKEISADVVFDSLERALAFAIFSQSCIIVVMIIPL